MISDDHIPAPAEHAPIKQMTQNPETDALIIYEEANRDAWVESLDFVEVKQ